MNKEMLTKFLNNLEIDSQLYELADSNIANDKFLLYPENHYWVVCYTERGKKFNIEKYISEQLAYLALIYILLNSSYIKKTLSIQDFLYSEDHKLFK